MGPSDPFSSPTDTADARAPRPGRAEPSGRTRVEARLPDPPRSSRARRGPLAGAVIGLVLGALVVTVGVGPALVVLLCVALGAGLGALAQSAFADGVDLAAAWRALRRQ